MSIKTAGDLRGFLADVLVEIQAGKIDAVKATAISKVAAQINQSLAVEVKASLQLEEMGEGRAVAGSMLLRGGEVAAIGGGMWCEQCDKRVTAEKAANCKSEFCKMKVAT